MPALSLIYFNVFWLAEKVACEIPKGGTTGGGAGIGDVADKR
jgi:hypothetical protein